MRVRVTPSRAWLLLALLLAGGAATAGTLDRVRESAAFRLGYRVDAAPFAYEKPGGEPAGYTVELCRFVAAFVRATLELERMDIRYVPVTAENRFDAVREGRVDILCGATTATLSRRTMVDFSLFTFIDGASVLYRADGPDDFAGLDGHKVGVRAGTTTERALYASLSDLGVDAEVVAVENHRQGLAELESGALSAYFADRAILAHLLGESHAPRALRLSERYFTHEPYALALPYGDNDFRLVVDRALSRLYRTGEIANVFEGAFGPDVQPTDVLRALYLINALAE